MWDVVVEEVAASRGLTAEELNACADDLSALLADDAVARRLVDGVKYEDEMNDLFAEAGVEPTATASTVSCRSDATLRSWNPT